MLDNESQQICTRFFEAIAYLKENRMISGEREFCSRYQINPRNMFIQRNDPARQIFKPSWLTYLVRDYGVSATWLLTGSGPVMAETDRKTQERAINVQKIKQLLDKVL